MKGKFHPTNDVTLNPDTSSNNSIRDAIDQFTGRRNFLRGSLGGATLATLGGFGLVGQAQAAYPAAAAPAGPITFNGVPPNLAATYVDAVNVPAGYTAKSFIAWGDAIGRQGPDALIHHNAADAITEARQLTTFGQHNDGMHWFPFPTTGAGGVSSERGLLVVNHEYVDPGLHANTASYGTITMTPEIAKAQIAAHGVSVIETRKMGGQWTVVRPSPFARRVTGATPCRISGPAAGHPSLRTAADPAGTQVLGTLNNCAHGFTPWGTYLTCEENWNGYFGTTAAALSTAPLTAAERRYGLAQGGFGYRWHEVDSRFDFRVNPNEPNRFGWVVEIDPFNPNAAPIKRTALGRIKHESTIYTLAADGTLAFYTGDDERNDYMYKFVCAGKYNPANRAANRNLLDSGTLYVAKFNSDGTGTWLPLVHGVGPLTVANGWVDQGDVLVRTRQAADAVGATMMDRPEWVAVHPVTREVYLTLTNNNRRGSTPASSNNSNGSTTAGAARPPVDAANPRPDNRYGHIIRWTEAGSRPEATSFAWDIFVEAGDRLDPDSNHKGNVIGDDFGAPDGLWFDQDGRLWIQTDQQGDGLGDWTNIGGNSMLCANPATRQVTRFLTSPRNCEVTGVVSTPDGKTMFVGIQHPGEDWAPGAYTSKSSWPDSGANGPTTQAVAAKPRSAVVVVTKNDGGVIGT